MDNQAIALKLRHNIVKNNPFYMRFIKSEIADEDRIFIPALESFSADYLEILKNPDLTYQTFHDIVTAIKQVHAEEVKIDGNTKE